MLVTRQTELSLVHLRDLVETSLHGELGSILNATVLNEHGEVPLALLVLLPAEGVDVGVEVERPGLLELLAPHLLDLALEDVDTHVVDGVLQTGVLAVGAVTVVALDEHDLLASNVDLLLADISEIATSTGVGLLHVVGHTHSTTGKQVKTDQSTVLTLDGDKTNVVGVDVGVVVRWDSDGDLELSGQVGRAVERLEVLNGIAGDLLLLVVTLLEPDLVVGSSGWQEVVRDLLGAGVGFLVQLVELRKGRAHDVTVDITAGRDGGHESLVDSLHGGLQFSLYNSVELEGLAGGELHGLVAKVV